MSDGKGDVMALDVVFIVVQRCQCGLKRCFFSVRFVVEASFKLFPRLRRLVIVALSLMYVNYYFRLPCFFIPGKIITFIFPNHFRQQQRLLSYLESFKESSIL